jgi:rod shape determining protein RodA
MPVSDRKTIPSLFQRVDWLAILLQSLLLGIGVVFIYGTGLEIGGEFARKWYKQLLWIGFGIIVYLAALIVDYRRLGKISVLFYLCGIALLCLLFPIGETINGARSWIILPGLGQLQPSELAKPATLFFAAWLGSRPALRNSVIHPAMAITAVIMLPFLLICLQPDYGTALVFLPFTAALILLTGLQWRWILAGIILMLIALPLVYQVMAPHQRERIKVFLEAPAQAMLLASKPMLNERMEERLQQKVEAFFAVDDGKLRDTWNAEQSLLAVGSGGITGKGYLKGTHHVLGYLPKTVAPTDFIFSVIAEETGFLGSAVLLILLTCLILCFCRTALLAQNNFAASLALGAAVVIATHVIINIGMTVQAAPIIGIPLPYVSYGGSFMISIMLLSGLVQNVHIHRQLEKESEDEE